MKNLFLLSFAVAFASMVTACNEPDGPNVSNQPTEDGLLTLSTELLEFTAEGDTETVDITGKNWNSVPSADWIGVAETESGITVTVGRNESTEPRSGSVTISNNEDSKIISVRQEGDEPPVDNTLTITPARVTFPVEGGSETFMVTSEPAWTATPAADWITVELVDGGFKVTVGACPLAAGRGGVVMVDNGNQEEFKYVAVDQTGTGEALSTFTGDVDMGEFPLGRLACLENTNNGLCDAYTTTSWTSGVSFNRRFMGTGYYITTQFNASLESGGVLPNGVYQIARNDNPWHVLGGFTPNGMAFIGMWLYQLENDVEVAKGPIVYGTLTVSRTEDIYTIEIDALDDAGNAVTGTLTGTGA